MNNVVGNRNPVQLRLLVEDGDSCLEVRGLYVGHETGFETRDEAFLQRRYLLGRPVARQHNLLTKPSILFQKIPDETIEEMTTILNKRIEEALARST